MNKLFNHAISGLLLGVLLCSSLGIVQGSNSTPVQESDPLPAIKFDLPPTSATSISVGSDHICAVTTEGGVRCWGTNYYGQLGDGTTEDSTTPVDLVGLEDEEVIAVSAGYAHTCAVTSAGGVKCWGSNDDGQLGDGTTDQSPVPVEVVDLDSVVKSISVGYNHTCALTLTGEAKCWGGNSNGQLGDGTTDERHIPEDVSGLTSGVKAIRAGSYFTCALTSAGGVMCWGYNGDGQLGNNTTVDSSTPVVVEDLTSGVQAISVGEYHSCALNSGGGVMCWGYNYDGQLGVDPTTTENSSTPVQVSGLNSGGKSLSGGGYHNCVLMESGEVMCWGDNGYGRLGDGTTTDRYTPVLVTELAIEVKAISAGIYNTCVLSTGGAVKCWGKNDYGQLGDGTTSQLPTPVDVIGLTSGVKEVSADHQYTCALTETGGVKCWGDEFYGLYDPDGDFENTNSSIPADVEGLTSGVQAIATGKYHACTVTKAGGVKCWGCNYGGQLGDGTFNNSLTPVVVDGFDDNEENAIAVTAGDDHTCALTDAGEVKCWGYNYMGQLGDGTTNIRSNIPVYVDGFGDAGEDEGAIAISAGSNHTCVITSENGIKCWGYNNYGQLGDGKYINSNTPVVVTGFPDEGENASEISAGWNHTCAITSEKGIKCWGFNQYGQLGNNDDTSTNTPVIVDGFDDGGQDAATISAGYQHTCAVTSSGDVKCWGDNSNGQLGDGTIGYESDTPVDVVGLSSGAKAVSAGGSHTCAITNTDGVMCWGDNTFSQLGWRVIWVPVDVLGFVDIIDFLIYLPMIVR